SYGTVYFPLAFLILAAFWWEKPITLVLSILIMTFSDTIAAMVGERTKHPRQFKLWVDIKSIEGCVGMFLSTFMIIYVGTDAFAWLFDAAFFIPLSILIGVSGFVAMLVTLSESNSYRGSDNFSVPIIAALSYDLYLINYTHGNLHSLLTWSILSGIAFYIVFRLKSLSKNGVVAAYIMGIIIFGTGGLKWIVPIITFFILSSIISKISKSDNQIHKGSKRDIIQVLANGGIATIISIINFYAPNENLYVIYLAVIAAATADTWASEIGSFSYTDPFHVVKFTRVPKGTSGAISFFGTFGSVLGATTIALVGLFWNVSLTLIYLIVITGSIGSLIDSFIGGSIQANFQCLKCNNITEKRTHCNSFSLHKSGIYFIDNDMVNFLNTVSAIFILIILK
ncbi:MAG: DUF92 domain-containing protein, partial [Candidatus Neomarinimicrobiota bacterium]|nr:DUF92 domain-containing protein [Candidatus Neomarinimicrobiota bacterium]